MYRTSTLRFAFRRFGFGIPPHTETHVPTREGIIQSARISYTDTQRSKLFVEQ